MAKVTLEVGDRFRYNGPSYNYGVIISEDKAFLIELDGSQIKKFDTGAIPDKAELVHSDHHYKNDFDSDKEISEHIEIAVMIVNAIISK